MATPAVGLFMMNLFNGSAIGLLALSAFLKVAAGLWLAKEMSTVDGRCVLLQVSFWLWNTSEKKAPAQHAAGEARRRQGEVKTTPCSNALVHHSSLSRVPQLTLGTLS